jgi:hypothetical protein
MGKREIIVVNALDVWSVIAYWINWIKYQPSH